MHGYCQTNNSLLRKMTHSQKAWWEPRHAAVGRAHHQYTLFASKHGRTGRARTAIFFKCAISLITKELLKGNEQSGETFQIIAASLKCFFNISYLYQNLEGHIFLNLQHFKVPKFSYIVL